MSETVSPDKKIQNVAITIRERLEEFRPIVADMISKHMKPENVFSVLSIMMTRNRELALCTESSLIGAMINCSRLGLDPTPELGLVALVPRKNKKNEGRKECNFQIMYRGLIKLAKRSSNILDIIAHPVYEDDEFSIEHHSNPPFNHKPNLTERNGKKIIGAYAAALLSSNRWHFEWMSMDQINIVRQRSDAESSTFSPWNTFPTEMIRKTPLKRCAKMLDLQTEEQRAIATDERFIHAEDFDSKDKELFLTPEQQDYDVENESPSKVKQEVTSKLEDRVKKNNNGESKDEAKSTETAKEEPPDKAEGGKEPEPEAESKQEQSEEKPSAKQALVSKQSKMVKLYVAFSQAKRQEEWNALMKEFGAKNAKDITDIDVADQIIERANQLISEGE